MTGWITGSSMRRFLAGILKADTLLARALLGIFLSAWWQRGCLPIRSRRSLGNGNARCADLTEAAADDLAQQVFPRNCTDWVPAKRRETALRIPDLLTLIFANGRASWPSTNEINCSGKTRTSSG